ncbi:MAG: hypothetical protein NT018_01160 [Armatimonadetes bacterium]|nr:hypothetical protein [Armatimonadota bacterium]
MKKSQAEEDIQIIREVMERSARYTHFSGLSGVLSGILALIGCAITYWVNFNISELQQNNWYALTWSSVLIAAIAEDLMLAQRNAQKNGGSIWVPATYQVMKAIFPGVFVAFVISLTAMLEGALDAIPGVWALGYGAALCAAGMFTVKEVWVYGIIQLITGSASLLVLSQPAIIPREIVPIISFSQLALSFGIYQIVFGLWMTRKYRK